MKKTLLLTNHYDGIPKKLLEEAVAGDFELKMLTAADQNELIEAVSEADYLLVSGRLSINKEVLDHAQKLKMIQRTGVGLDNMDLELLKERQIPLYVNKGVNSVSVAEYTMMLILSTLKRSVAVNAQIRKGIWKKQATGLSTHELSGKTVGLVGLGNIGKKVACMLRPFDVNIVYYDAFRLSEEDEQELGFTYTEFEKLIEVADIISLHCPYDKNIGAIIGADEISRMKSGVILINTARGKLIDTQALAEAIESGQVSACGIDTFEEEPISSDMPLLGFEQATLSPHIAGVSYEAFKRMMDLGVENIRAYDRGDLERIQMNKYL